MPSAVPTLRRHGEGDQLHSRRGYPLPHGEVAQCLNKEERMRRRRLRRRRSTVPKPCRAALIGRPSPAPGWHTGRMHSMRQAGCSDIAACRAAFRRGLIQAPTRGSRPILLIKISRFSLLYPFYVFRLFYDYLPASAWPSTPGQISQYLYAPGGCGRLATCSPHPSGQLFRSINHQRCAIAAGSAL